MRTLITFLIFLIFLLMGNIGMYMLSEDYRFFLKKLKYQEDVIYDQSIIVDDTEKIRIIDTDVGAGTQEKDIVDEKSNFTFLDALSGKINKSQDTSKEMNIRQEELDFLDKFQKAYVLKEVEEPQKLFDFTDEYPDPYKEWENKYIHLYIFPTKTYSEVKDIFEVLSFDLPYTMNEVNNLGEASFYINMKEGFEDDMIRIILQYKKRAFGLKIKKDSYNRAKEILKNL